MIEDIEANDPRVTVFEMINTDHFTKMVGGSAASRTAHLVYLRHTRTI